MLAKKYRVHNPFEFQRIYKYGYKAKGRYGMLIGLSRPAPVSGTEARPEPEMVQRFGFIVSKKIGNAVHRHRFTRKLRAIAKQAIDAKVVKRPAIFQYIAFEYNDNYKLIKQDFAQMLDKVLKNI